MSEIKKAASCGVIKVALKRIWGPFLSPRWLKKQVVRGYDLEGLKNNIKENGLLNPLDIEVLWFSIEPDVKYWGAPKEMNKLALYKYRISNGNHRAYCLMDIYGENYEVEVRATCFSTIDSDYI